MVVLDGQRLHAGGDIEAGSFHVPRQGVLVGTHLLRSTSGESLIDAARGHACPLGDGIGGRGWQDACVPHARSP